MFPAGISVRRLLFGNSAFHDRILENPAFDVQLSVVSEMDAKRSIFWKNAVVMTNRLQLRRLYWPAVRVQDVENDRHPSGSC
jgi:hypothetical protein